MEQHRIITVSLFLRINLIISGINLPRFFRESIKRFIDLIWKLCEAASDYLIAHYLCALDGNET